MNTLDQQQEHWNQSLKNKKQMFGPNPSYAAIKAATYFKEKGLKRILELGPGQGRDTLYFLEEGFEVVALDYAPSALDDLQALVEDTPYASLLTCHLQDLRQSIPLEDESFDACYSHMFYCMAFTLEELTDLTREIHRLLKVGGLHAYTSRNITDADYGQGQHHGENLWQDGRVIIHYLDDDMIQRFAEGFQILLNDSFDEGSLPRKLTLIIQEKQS